jgi:hemoglobin
MASLCSGNFVFREFVQKVVSWKILTSNESIAPHTTTITRMNQEEPTSIYERIGGAEGIDGLVDEFYESIMSDEVLKPYFKHASTGKIINMQKQFFAAATGGPLIYAGKPLKEVHKHMGISRYEFDRYVGHLVKTLETRGINGEDSREVVAMINIYADDITNDTQS